MSDRRMHARRRSAGASVMATLLAVAVRAEPPEAQVTPPEYTATVEVKGRPIYSVTKQFFVRDTATKRVLTNIEPEQLTVELKLGGGSFELPADASVRFEPTHGDAALTLVLDSSGSMRGQIAREVGWAAELVQALPDTDFVRVVAFADYARATAWLRADVFRSTVLRTWLDWQARKRRRHVDETFPCLATGRPDAGRPEDSTWGDWLVDCDVPQQLAIERAAIAHLLFGLTAPTGGTNPDAGMGEALRGMIPDPSLPFTPGRDVSLGVAIMSDEGFGNSFAAMDEALDVLLVQTWCFGAGGRFWFSRGSVSLPIPPDDQAAEAARAVITSLHSTWSVTIDSTDERMTRRGALRMHYSWPGAGEAEVIAPVESLPPLDVLQAAWAEAADGTGEVDVRQFVRSLGLRSKVARDYLAVSSPALVPERVPAAPEQP